LPDTDGNPPGNDQTFFQNRNEYAGTIRPGHDRTLRDELRDMPWVSPGEEPLSRLPGIFTRQTGQYQAMHHPAL
jgi:hypothetical protein